MLRLMEVLQVWLRMKKKEEEEEEAGEAFAISGN